MGNKTVKCRHKKEHQWIKDIWEENIDISLGEKCHFQWGLGEEGFEVYCLHTKMKNLGVKWASCQDQEESQWVGNQKGLTNNMMYLTDYEKLWIICRCTFPLLVSLQLSTSLKIFGEHSKGLVEYAYSSVMARGWGCRVYCALPAVTTTSTID
jgi:hypothetical protein